MFKRLVVLFICFALILTNQIPLQAKDFALNQLPLPGAMVMPSLPLVPLAIKGIIVNPQKPLEFQFIVDCGQGPQDISGIKKQANRLIKYFLAGLTVPEGDLWVNLSPYEKDRMIAEDLGQTDLGRDLLAQDYILKQLTASLIYPENHLGKEFWNRVYARAQRQYGTTNIAIDTFNKVWILPNQAQVYNHVNAAYITQSTLKVMLDEDYLALKKHEVSYSHSLASQLVRQIILPEIEKEVNTGANFASLRQMYQALILAKWYKQAVKNALLQALYLDKDKTTGINLADPSIKEAIYARYLQAYKKGVFNFIEEDITPQGELTPRKYFSGGIRLWKFPVALNGRESDIKSAGKTLGLVVILNKSAAMTVNPGPEYMFPDQIPAKPSRLNLRHGLRVVLLVALLVSVIAFISPKINSGENHFQSEEQFDDFFKYTTYRQDIEEGSFPVNVTFFEQMMPFISQDTRIDFENRNHAYHTEGLKDLNFDLNRKSYRNFTFPLGTAPKSFLVLLPKNIKPPEENLVSQVLFHGRYFGIDYTPLVVHQLRLPKKQQRDDHIPAGYQAYLYTGIVDTKAPQYYLPYLGSNGTITITRDQLNKIERDHFHSHISQQMILDAHIIGLTPSQRHQAWNELRRQQIVNDKGDVDSVRFLRMTGFDDLHLGNIISYRVQPIYDLMAKEGYSEDYPRYKARSHSVAFNNPAQVGGIDLSKIDLDNQGKQVTVHFDPAQLNQLMQGDFEGFEPLIKSMAFYSDPFVLLHAHASYQR